MQSNQVSRSSSLSRNSKINNESYYENSFIDYNYESTIGLKRSLIFLEKIIKIRYPKTTSLTKLYKLLERENQNTEYKMKFMEMVNKARPPVSIILHTKNNNKNSGYIYYLLAMEKKDNKYYYHMSSFDITNINSINYILYKSSLNNDSRNRNKSFEFNIFCYSEDNIDLENSFVLM